MQRLVVFALFSLSLLSIVVTASCVEEGFQRWSYMGPTPDTNGVSSMVFAGGSEVAFVHDHDLYTADGTSDGTKEWSDTVYQDKLVSFNQQGLNYVFYSTGGELKYFDPASGESTLVRSWIDGTTTYYGTPVFATKTKVFALWHIPGLFQFYSYQPQTQVFSIEAAVPDHYQVAADDVVVWNDRVVSRYDLVAESTSGSVPFTSLPTRLFYSETLDTIFFNYNAKGLGNELWKTTGADLKKLELVADIHQGPSDSNPIFYCDVPGVGLFFFATAGDPDHITLFLLDPGFTLHRVYDFHIQFYTVIPIVKVGHRVVFLMVLVDDTIAMWSSDGTTDGTMKLMNVDDHYWYELASVGDLAFTVSDTDEFGWELYQTDGTVEGTVRVPHETIEGPGSSDPSGLVAINGDLFFNANTPDDGVQLFKFSPDRVPYKTLGKISPTLSCHILSIYLSIYCLLIYAYLLSSIAIFDVEEEWVEPGAIQYTWGVGGTCDVETRSAPTNFPLFASTLPLDYEDEKVFSIDVGSDYFGCGHYYPTFLDLAGAKELRFWISSTIDAKVELEVDQPCKPFRPVAGQHPCKPFVLVPSTKGEWQSFGITLNDRSMDEFQRIYSPFLITAFGGSGKVYITNIVYVY